MRRDEGFVSEQRNVNGFLKSRSDWSKDIAGRIAEKDGITLTAKHWDVIHYIRTEFYANQGLVPLEREVRRGMERAWNTRLKEADLLELFPGGTTRQGAKIAGCITVATVADLLKVKGDAVWAIEPEQSILAALKLLSEKNIGALMVVDNGKLVGIVSERDYTRDVVLNGRAAETTRVSDIMSDNVVSVSSEDTLENCMELMIERGFRHLPVVDLGRLSGVLSMPDLVKVVVAQHQFRISQLEDYSR